MAHSWDSFIREIERHFGSITENTNNKLLSILLRIYQQNLAVTLMLLHSKVLKMSVHLTQLPVRCELEPEETEPCQSQAAVVSLLLLRYNIWQLKVMFSIIPIFLIILWFGIFWVFFLLMFYALSFGFSLVRFRVSVVTILYFILRIRDGSSQTLLGWKSSRKEAQSSGAGQRRGVALAWSRGWTPVLTWTRQKGSPEMGEESRGP